MILVSYGTGIQCKSVSYAVTTHPSWCDCGYLVHSSQMFVVCTTKSMIFHIIVPTKLEL
jgi:hypothetical protein